MAMGGAQWLRVPVEPLQSSELLAVVRNTLFTTLVSSVGVESHIYSHTTSCLVVVER